MVFFCQKYKTNVKINNFLTKRLRFLIKFYIFVQLKFNT